MQSEPPGYALGWPVDVDTEAPYIYPVIDAALYFNYPPDQPVGPFASGPGWDHRFSKTCFERPL